MALMFYVGHTQHFAVAPDKNNVFYVGVDNPLTITVENCACKDLVVKTDNGKITGNNCQYVYKGNQYGSASIILYKKNGIKLKEIGRNAFRIKRIPAPVFKIAQYGSFNNMNADRKANKITLAAQQYVRAEIEGFDFDGRCIVDSFSVSIFYSDSCKSKTFFNLTNKLTESIRVAIAALKKDDIILFNKIHVKGLDGLDWELDPLMLTIEN